MGFTPEKIAAQEQIEAAIEAIVVAFGSFNQGEMPIGWTLVVCGARMNSPEHDEDYSDEDDEEEMVSRYVTFCRRGQQPVVTRGMLESCIDRWRQ